MNFRMQMSSRKSCGQNSTKKSLIFIPSQRCVVVQEVFPDGLIAQDGRLRPGDQIIEINGVDMTCANHLQVSLCKMIP